MASGYPVPGKTMVYDESHTIDLDNEPLHGGVLVKLLALSIDPYLRRRMVPNVDDFRVVSTRPMMSEMSISGAPVSS